MLLLNGNWLTLNKTASLKLEGHSAEVTLPPRNWNRTVV